MANDFQESGQEYTLKSILVEGLTKCNIKMEGKQFEVASVEVKCNMKNDPNKPYAAKYAIKKSTDFPENLFKAIFDKFNEKIEEINREADLEWQNWRQESENIPIENLGEKQVSEEQKKDEDIKEKAFEKCGIAFRNLPNELQEKFIVAEQSIQGEDEPKRLYCLAFLDDDLAGEYGELIKYVLDKVLDKGKRNLLQRDANFEYLCSDLLSNRRTLFGKYVDDYLRDNGFPSDEILTELSAEKYEGSESEARIYLKESEVSTIGILDETGRKYRKICPENRRMIRKLMEICKRGRIYLYAEREGKDYVITRLVEKNSTYNQDGSIADTDTYVKFSGFLSWSVVYQGVEKVGYCQGRYIINQSKNATSYLTKIDNLKTKLSNEKRIEFDEWFNKHRLEELIEILSRQRHGTSVIITDDQSGMEEESDASDRSETKRLCRLNRGILLNGEQKMCHTVEGGWDEEQLLSVTSIDGILFMDLDENCMALGVLVDGQAKVPGDVGRGSRYNSIRNYIELKRGHGIYLGIIVSEDGQIDLECNLCQNN